MIRRARYDFRRAGSIPDASFTVLDRVAHLAALEEPARVNELLDAFLFG